MSEKYPSTPDGRYFIVRDRLWRKSDPRLGQKVREALVADLMSARRDVGAALRCKDEVAVAGARARVDVAKRRLGERGTPWWTDGAPDLNRHLVQNTRYAEWYAALFR